MGTTVVATEPEIGAAALAVTGGDLSRLVEHSATFADLFLALLLPKLGLDAAALDPDAYPASFHPELAIYQTLLDGETRCRSPRCSRSARRTCSSRWPSTTRWCPTARPRRSFAPRGGGSSRPIPCTPIWRAPPRRWPTTSSSAPSG
ncbi:MAG: hypothetical protein M5U28_32760 [Sandaracinaceae bacterium]|nr:hypothetical protein [Sandaracinaceae bacterium]